MERDTKKDLCIYGRRPIKETCVIEKRPLYMEKDLLTLELTSVRTRNMKRASRKAIFIEESRPNQKMLSLYMNRYSY